MSSGNVMIGGICFPAPGHNLRYQHELKRCKCNVRLRKSHTEDSVEVLQLNWEEETFFRECLSGTTETGVNLVLLIFLWSSCFLAQKTQMRDI